LFDVIVDLVLSFSLRPDCLLFLVVPQQAAVDKGGTRDIFVFVEHDEGELARAEKNGLSEGAERWLTDNLCRMAGRRADNGRNRHGESVSKGMR
jgi:hypothetical protein